MSFFSEEQSSELKDLFFESAGELLQALNEQGLQLEHQPNDAEIIRSVRRTVHTLKGDSAACGYRELSELAHAMEDVLTPELAKSANGSLAELVLNAADLFTAMLKAYRKDGQPPSGDALRAHIRKLTSPAVKQSKPAKRGKAASELVPRFQWTEYQQMAIAEALSNGKQVMQVAIGIDAKCPMRSAAFQLIRNVLNEAGTILAMQPEESTGEPPNVIEAALVTHLDQDSLVRKCQIPAVVNAAVVRPYESPAKAITDANKKIDSQLSNSSQQAAVTENKVTEAEQRSSATAQPNAGAPVDAIDSILRVDAGRIDTVLNLVGELIIGKSMLHQTFTEFDKKFPKDPLRNKFADAMNFQARVLSDLQKSVMKIRMVPVEQLFRRFPRLVRDVAKMREREVELEISGEDTDLDKSILDVLAEPLTHLIRNAVDHGIESPAERIAAGKLPQGKLQLKAYHQGNQIVIEICDDGRGIDRDKVIAKAIDAKLVSRADASRLSETEALNLIFHSGLSTADEVTSISGRGVGMDVVKTIVERLKGTIQIKTELGRGTTFYLKVPLTLAIIQALLFRVSQRIYAVPLSSVVEITRSYEHEFHRVDHREVFQLRDRVVTLVRLRDSDSPPARGSSQKVFVIVINFGEQHYGLLVDRLVGEEELVIKALDDQLVATDLVSGASILGDGTVVLVLNIAAVIGKLGKAQSKGIHVLERGASA